MDNIEERIPAFTTWKMFNDTIPALINSDCCENSLVKLINIVNHKEFSNLVFVYNRDSGISFDEYEEMSKMYKAFTMWLLGRLYYFLSSSKLTG